MGGEQDELEAVGQLVDAVFNGDARHEARALLSNWTGILRPIGAICGQIKPAASGRAARSGWSWPEIEKGEARKSASPCFFLRFLYCR
jgi:hypothetical protein